MNWLDLLLLAILVFSAVRSLRRGFAREVIGLAASVFSLILAMWFYGMAGAYLMPWVNSQRLANLLGFLLVVATVLMMGGLLSWIVNRFLRTIGLSFFDRFFGALFGLARGSLLAIALLTAYMAFGTQRGSDATPQAVIHSKIAPYVLEASRVAVAIAPMDLKQNFQEYYSRVQTAAQRVKKSRPGNSKEKGI